MKNYSMHDAPVGRKEIRKDHRSILYVTKETKILRKQIRVCAEDDIFNCLERKEIFSTLVSPSIPTN